METQTNTKARELDAALAHLLELGLIEVEPETSELIARCGTTDPAILIRLTVAGNKDAQMFLSRQLAESIENNLTEILSDANAEETAEWSACASFSDLHDVCDANMLGDTAEIWNGLQEGINPEGDEARVQLCCDVVNAAQSEVDGWIKAGGLKVECPC